MLLFKFLVTAAVRDEILLFRMFINRPSVLFAVSYAVLSQEVGKQVTLREIKFLRSQEV